MISQLCPFCSQIFNSGKLWGQYYCVDCQVFVEYVESGISFISIIFSNFALNFYNINPWGSLNPYLCISKSFITTSCSLKYVLKYVYENEILAIFDSYLELDFSSKENLEQQLNTLITFQ